MTTGRDCGAKLMIVKSELQWIDRHTVSQVLLQITAEPTRPDQDENGARARRMDTTRGGFVKSRDQLIQLRIPKREMLGTNNLCPVGVASRTNRSSDYFDGSETPQVVGDVVDQPE